VSVVEISCDFIQEVSIVEISCDKYLFVISYHSSSADGGEIRLEIFGSPDFLGFPETLDGDSVNSRENLFEILETPEKTCLICTGTPVKTCWKFWQS